MTSLPDGVEFAPYQNGFVLHQIEPNIYEAKLANDINFRPSHQKALTVKMLRLGAKRVDLWRHKDGEEPYMLSIHADGKITRTAQKQGEISGDLSDLKHEVNG